MSEKLEVTSNKSFIYLAICFKRALKNQVEKGEIRSVEEYDISLIRAKTTALHTATLSNRKEYMIQFLDDEKVR